MSMNLADDTLLFADESTTDGDEQATPVKFPVGILVVDDDASVLTVTKMALREFKVEAAQQQYTWQAASKGPKTS